MTAAALLLAAAGVRAETVRKEVLRLDQNLRNLVSATSWSPYERGAAQAVVLNQASPLPFTASVESRAEGVDGVADADYSLYLDLIHQDGTPQWGVSAPFSAGTHGWERREIRHSPVKPVREVRMYQLFRKHAGNAWFRNAALAEFRLPPKAGWFDGLPVRPVTPLPGGFELRDVAVESDVVALGPGPALGVDLAVTRTERDGRSRFRARITDRTGRDRAVTLYFSRPLTSVEWTWAGTPGADEPAAPPREYLCAARASAGASGLLSRFPLGAVVAGREGRAVALDPALPAFFRTGYSAGTAELWIAFDLALTPERPSADVGFVTWNFDGTHGWRSAVRSLHQAFPEAFRVRVPRQGLWMPFQAVSGVAGREDFGFAFKEGTGETAWDDAHDLLTFRYTEPLTWWMPMGKNLSWTREGAEAEARRRATAGEPAARALLACGFHDEAGRLHGLLRREPWNEGAVWSLNSAPGLGEEGTDFGLKFGPAVREDVYGPNRRGDVDGEYIDSIEGYVTAELDHRRDHFASAAAPLTFSTATRKPGVFKGLIAWEYLKGIADEMHGRGKLVMANGTPDRFAWLAAELDVLGTEWDWNPGGAWQPVSDAELSLRRALSGAKPYCFLMNTDFDRLPPEAVERYMKTCLAFGMFPGFFSPNAADGHYFGRPELYNRDRPLFKTYVPLIRRLAEAGWRPVPGARSDDPAIRVERFGDAWLTVRNAGERARRARIAFAGSAPKAVDEVLEGRAVERDGDSLLLTLDAGDVALLEFRQLPQSSTTPIAPERSARSMR